MVANSWLLLISERIGLSQKGGGPLVLMGTVESLFATVVEFETEETGRKAANYGGEMVVETATTVMWHLIM